MGLGLGLGFSQEHLPISWGKVYATLFRLGCSVGRSRRCTGRGRCIQHLTSSIQPVAEGFIGCARFVDDGFATAAAPARRQPPRENFGAFWVSRGGAQCSSGMGCGKHLLCVFVGAMVLWSSCASFRCRALFCLCRCRCWCGWCWWCWC